MNFKKTIFILVIIVFLLQIMLLKQDAKTASNKIQTSEKPSLALSIFPLYDIAKNIAKDKIETYMILPVGVDVHSYEPNPKEMVRLYQSSLVVYSGADLEPWISALGFQNKTLDMSQYVELIDLGESKHEEHDKHDACSHSSVDPHYWLSISNMKIATKKITDALIGLDATNKDFYLQNQKEYMKKLLLLDAQYKSSISTCKTKEIVTNHNAFSYLGRSYGFKIISLSDLSPDAEVSAKSMINLIDHIKEHNISTIFYESFASSNAVSSIAKESNIKIEVLQPLANITAEEQKQNLSYEDIMRKNLSKLKEAMDCQ